MDNRVCAGCGAPLTGRRRKWCSKPCQMRAWHRNYRELHGEDQSAASRRRRGVTRHVYEITCSECDERAFVTDKSSRFCSNDCWQRVKSRAARDRRLPVLHPNPPAYSNLPPSHPARRPSKVVRRWWRVFAAGECAWCGESFVGQTTHIESLPRYCSTRCMTQAQRARRGRFVLPDRVRRAIYERDGWACQLCSEPVDPDLGPSVPWGATLDHIICQSWGDEPDHSPGNLRLAHRWCNSVRADEKYHTIEVLQATA